MDKLPNSKSQPLRLIVTDTPEPSVRIESDDDSVDLTQRLVYVRPQLSGEGCFVELMLEADIEWNFAVREVTQVREMPALTAEQYNEIILSGGASTTPGEKIEAHLRNLAGGE